MSNYLNKLVLIILLFLPIHAVGEQQKIFSTWKGFELDKCASIWLIKRFIASDAEIRFFPKGEQIKEGIPFDTPDAKFRRYHNKSTYEMFVAHYQLKDDKLDYIGRIVHDVEVNIWEKKIMTETPKIQLDVQKFIFQDNKSKIINDCQIYFDAFYDKLSL